MNLVIKWLLFPPLIEPTSPYDMMMKKTRHYPSTTWLADLYRGHSHFPLQVLEIV